MSTGGSLATAAANQSGIQIDGSFAGKHYSVEIGNLSLDISNSTVYADITTVEGTFTHQKFLIPTSALFVWPTETSGSPVLASGSDGYLHATGSFTNLVVDGSWDPATKIASGTLGILNRGFGIYGAAGGTLIANNFADVSYDVRFAVPEPSTYALMLAGLMSVAALAFRNRNCPIRCTD